MSAAEIIPVPTRPRPRPEARHYAVAVKVVLVAAGARHVLAPLFGEQLPFLTFFPAVGIAAWYGNEARIVATEPRRCPTLARALEAGAPIEVEVGGHAHSLRRTVRLIPGRPGVPSVKEGGNRH